MPGWTLVDTHPTQGRTFRRPLDVFELGFLWDGLFNGTADSIQRLELRLVNDSRDAHLFSKANVVRAWLSTKRRYPLARATIQGTSSPLRISPQETTGFDSEPHFVVREHDLAVLCPGEIVFGQVTCKEEVRKHVAAIFDGPRPLSEGLLAKLYVFYVPDWERTPVLHLATPMAHCVTDGISNATFLRCLVDTLARGGQPGLEPIQIPLEERLAMAIPSADLEPTYLRSLSPARRRWRRAIGAVIFQLRTEKRQGGHTLPCCLTRSTSYISARSCRVSTSLTHEQTVTLLANCRLHNLTFGNAYLVLAQVAMTRVLCRRYLRGEISEEEWIHRKRQPHISGGPLNLRPYLDKKWFEMGGGGEYVLSIGFFYSALPFMTLGAMAERYQHRKNDGFSDGAPPFSDLLTFDRFLHRAGLLKKQAATFFSHPLLHEIVRAAGLARIENTHLGALQWMRRVEIARGTDMQMNSMDDKVLALTDIPVVWAHGGSSFGNMDLISPSEYPLARAHPLSPYSSIPHPMRAGYVNTPSPPTSEDGTTPRIKVENSEVLLHTRPAELYLGAASSRGRLNMYIFYDANVFEEEVVKEWLDEVKAAALWYLGRTHLSRNAQQHRSRASLEVEGRAVRGNGVLAKL